MFETLSERLSGALQKLTGKGALSEGDIGVALREVRVALLEADVSLSVTRSFIARVREKATGGAVLKSVTPGQQVVKIVHDELIRVLAGDNPAPGKPRIAPPPARTTGAAAPVTAAGWTCDGPWGTKAPTRGVACWRASRDGSPPSEW